ncbi:MAG: NUDIX domain-containing protein [Crocinitomicaceae bacterium]|nr:NUDIX domain-containing protein [Crocinitomicaceae bacterium]
MYKVFIDHKPIIFATHEELSTNFERIKLSEFDAFFTEITLLLDKVDTDHPLQIEMSVISEFNELFSGHELIEAAGGIVVSNNGYLTIERNGLWDLPKGKMEEGENTEICAVREIEEECGIQGPKIKSHLVDTFHTYEYKGRPVLKKTYWYLMTYNGNEKLVPQTEEGITKVEWMSYTDLMAIRGKTYGSINEVLDVFKSVSKED